jgi:hypothetical protein
MRSRTLGRCAALLPALSSLVAAGLGRRRAAGIVGLARGRGIAACTCRRLASSSRRGPLAIWRLRPISVPSRHAGNLEHRQQHGAADQAGRDAEEGAPGRATAARRRTRSPERRPRCRPVASLASGPAPLPLRRRCLGRATGLAQAASLVTSRRLAAAWSRRRLALGSSSLLRRRREEVSQGRRGVRVGPALARCLEGLRRGFLPLHTRLLPIWAPGAVAASRDGQRRRAV